MGRVVSKCWLWLESEEENLINYLLVSDARLASAMCIEYTPSHWITVFQWCESQSVMSDSLRPHGLYSPGQNTEVGNLSLLKGIFPNQGSNPGLPHCGQILYQLSHQGSPRILEWVAYPFSSGSSWPRNGTRVSWIAGVFFTNWVMKEASFPW